MVVRELKGLIGKAAVIGPSTKRYVPIASVVVANTVSLTGSALTTVAVPWFVLVTTGSAAKTGITGADAVLPIVIASVFGGALVDRLGFKPASVLSDLLSGVAIVLIPLLYHTVGLSFWELLILLFFTKLLNVPGGLARRTMVPDLAGAVAMPLERANAAFGSAFSVASLFGPVLAGVLIASLGATNVLIIDAATFLASAAVVSLAVPSVSTAGIPLRGEKEHRAYLTGLQDGFVYLRRDRLVFVLALVSAAVNLAEMPLIAVILPVYAKRVFGSAVDLGVVLSGLGVGTLAGTILYGVLAQRLPRRWVLIGGLLLVGSATAALAFLPNVGIATAILIAAGIAGGPLGPLLQTITQERVPGELLGRVFGLISAVAVAAAPVGLLLAGLLLEDVGLRVTILLDAALILLISLSLLTMASARHLD